MMKLSEIVKFSRPIQSNIDSWQANIKEYQKAIREHTPELLETLTQHTAYLAYSEQILELQNDLNGFINLAKRQAIPSKKAPKQAEIEIAKKFAEASEKLTYQMSELLHSFATALLAKKKKESASFSQQIENIYTAALVDNAIKSGPPSTELADKLRTLTNSENFPQQYKDDFTFIINAISTSAHNTECAQYALAEIKSAIESAQAHAHKIISSNPPTVETITKLTEELSDEFYIGKFIASFTSFQCINKANREQQAAIENQLTKLASHCSGCENLQSLIFTWRTELAELEAIAINDPTQDNFSKLGEQLTAFKDSLETGDYFQAAKKTIVDYLTNLQNNVIARLDKDGNDIRTLILRANNNPPEKLSQLDKEYQTKRNEIKLWLKNYIDTYSQQQSLSTTLANPKISLAEITRHYTPIKSELEEYYLIYAILRKDINQDFVKQIHNTTLTEATLKNLIDKLFFMLRIEDSHQRRTSLENLTQFLETKEVQPNESADALLSFKQALKNAITEKRLKDFKQPHHSLEEICKLFRHEENASALLLLTPEAKAWFNKVKKTINDFEQCKLELDTKKNSYTPTFFLKPDDSKQQAVEQLKQRVAELPLSTTEEQLQETFDAWEKDYGAIIDEPRYRSFVGSLMKLYHSIQTLFSGKTFVTKTRALVARIEEQTERVFSSTHAAPHPGFSSKGL